MNSVADDLRAATRARVLAMPPVDRMALALRLGRRDLEAYTRSTGLAETVALLQLRAARQRGRAPSASARLEPR